MPPTPLLSYDILPTACCHQGLEASVLPSGGDTDQLSCAPAVGSCVPQDTAQCKSEASSQRAEGGGEECVQN